MSAPSLYQRLMGPAFDRLDEPVRRFHQLEGMHVLHGLVTTEAPTGWAARLIARALGTPLNASSGALRFELQAVDSWEVWTRHFPQQTMSSSFSTAGEYLEEHLGAARLSFVLRASDGHLVMHLARMQFFGVPCPSWALPRIVAEETGDNGRLNFTVRAALPLIGQVAGYVGYLELPATSTSKELT